MIKKNSDIKRNIYDGHCLAFVDFSNDTKQSCVMVLFALFFFFLCFTLYICDLYASGEFQLSRSRGLFNHQRFKVKTVVRTSNICNLLVADEVAPLIVSLIHKRHRNSSNISLKRAKLSAIPSACKTKKS